MKNQLQNRGVESDAIDEKAAFRTELKTLHYTEEVCEISLLLPESTISFVNTRDRARALLEKTTANGIDYYGSVEKFCVRKTWQWELDIPADGSYRPHLKRHVADSVHKEKAMFTIPISPGRWKWIRVACRHLNITPEDWCLACLMEAEFFAKRYGATSPCGIETRSLEEIADWSENNLPAAGRVKYRAGKLENRDSENPSTPI